jgi:hypothetical protein
MQDFDLKIAGILGTFLLKINVLTINLTLKKCKNTYVFREKTKILAT